ncbi:hypothetical protein WDW86_05120 [Bdellovibrionota bacterium FG-2]
MRINTLYRRKTRDLTFSTLLTTGTLIFSLTCARPARAEEEQKVEEVKETIAVSEIQSTPTATSLEKRDPRIPLYTTLRPSFGVQATGSLKAFGGKDINADQKGKPARALALEFEYQPPFIQAIGVVSLGLSANLFPIAAEAGLTPNTLSIWSGGGQIRYQARFFREQILVPMGGYEAEYMSYRFVSGVKSRVMAKGPFFGGYLLLNMFEPSAAAQMFATNGVTRTYLVAEYRTLKGSDANINLTGSSLYFGLRFEY